MPIAAINLGRTRADALLTLKVEQPCALALDALKAPAGRQSAAGFERFIQALVLQGFFLLLQSFP